MRDEQNRREAEACVHQRSILAERRSQECRMEGEQYASACTCRHLNFVSMKLELVGLVGDHARGRKHTKHQCMIFSVGSHEKAKCIDGRLAPHISSTIPQKSSRLPKDAADGERFHVTWQLRNSFVSFSVDGL
jgi:hypothetical protein